MKNKLKLIIFLGNPGNRFKQTRHNSAWLCLDYIPGAGKLSWKQKFNGVWCDYGPPGKVVRFLKPETFMNKSGESVLKAVSFFKAEPNEILVVHDELELPFGTIQFRKGGGMGGHNGLRSVKQHLGTGDFYRFRIGISRPPHGDVSRWVLSPFSGEEKPFLPLYWEQSARLLDSLILQESHITENEKTVLLESPH